MYKDTLKDSVVGADKSVEELQVEEFNVKELGEAKKILGMEIVRDRRRKILRVSQSGYVFKILNNFRIDNGKSVKMPLGGHFKLSLKDFPVRDYDVERMSTVPYANAVGSLMYLMVCMRSDIPYAEGIEGAQNPRYKARLVAHGFTQRAGIDYNEVFSPVVRHASIRVILALTACKDYELEQLDVKTSFYMEIFIK
nr:retrovirus-related Pol polyprotein from transposon TNT 1-94 [Tanacetum cinerariifolium]